jgi:hypothetical protein
MRVDPLDSDDLPFQQHRPVRVELAAEGMMCRGLDDGRQQKHSRKNNGYRLQ